MSNEFFPEILRYYSTDSRTKLQRRQEILQAAAQILNLKGYESLTMKELAKVLSLERRTLYSYYNSKEELMVDTYLYMVEHIGRLFSGEFSALFQSVSHLPLVERLTLGLIQYAKVLIEIWENYPFLFEYEPILRGLGKGSPGLIRFLDIRANIASQENIVARLMDTKRKTLESGKTLQIETVALVAEQSLRAYTVQIARRKNIAPHYGEENITRFVELLVPGLLQTCTNL